MVKHPDYLLLLLSLLKLPGSLRTPHDLLLLCCNGKPVWVTVVNFNIKPINMDYAIKLVYEGDVVTVEGEIIHELKASALSARDHYYIARVR